MKLHGQVPEPASVVIVLPRPNSNLVFTAKAILSYDDFNRLAPHPQPPEAVKPGNIKVKKYDDPGYLKAVEDRNELLTNWIVITSLRDTEGLEWEKVRYEDPTSWGKWSEELSEAGFPTPEINHIRRKCFEANALDNDRLEEALKSFQRARAEESAT
jgi:hypothetical protein